MSERVMRTYTKLVEVAGLSASFDSPDEFGLIDTSGNEVDCNYIKVFPEKHVASNDQPSFLVSIPASSIGGVDYNNLDPSGNTENNVVVGAIGSFDLRNPVVELEVPDKDSFKRILIGLSENTRESMILIYGRKQVENTLRSRLRNPGG